MRTSLSTSPKVVHISVALGVHVSAVCGACFVLWSIADTHSLNGDLPGYTYAVIDQLVGLPGFCKVASDARVGWVKQTAQGIVLPRFSEHNGDTAKRRAGKAKSEAKNRHKRGRNVDEAWTPEQKSRPPSREQHRAAESRVIAAAALEQNAPELCSLLLEIVHNGVRVFEPAAAAAIAGSTTRMQVVWAVERMNERFKGGKRVANPAGYLRDLIENQEPPRAWQERWRREQLAKVAAMANGTKAGVA